MKHNEKRSQSDNIRRIRISQLRLSGSFNRLDTESIAAQVLQQFERQGPPLNQRLQHRLSQGVARQIQDAVQAKMTSKARENQ